MNYIGQLRTSAVPQGVLVEAEIISGFLNSPLRLSLGNILVKKRQFVIE